MKKEMLSTVAAAAIVAGAMIPLTSSAAIFVGAEFAQGELTSVSTIQNTIVLDGKTYAVQGGVDLDNAFIGHQVKIVYVLRNGSPLAVTVELVSPND